MTGLMALALSSCGADDPAPGEVVVIVTTTGGGTDPDGYLLTMTGEGDLPVAPHDTVYYHDVSPGDKTLRLYGVDGVCSAGEPTPTHVPEGGIDSVTMTVNCPPYTGTLAVRFVTTGVAPDPNGYAVSIGGRTPVAVAINGTTVAISVPVGSQSIAFTDVAMNCAPDFAGPYLPYVGYQEVDTFRVDITCHWPRVVANLGDGRLALFNPDGSNEQLFGLPVSDLYTTPAWSLDRSHLAVHVHDPALPQVNMIGFVAPGSAPVDSVLPDSVQALAPRWKPNGGALLELRPDSSGLPLRAYSVDLATHARVQVSPDSFQVFSADWSPDGTQVAFAARVLGDTTLRTHVYLVQSNGTGVTRISPDSVQTARVRWSPAGGVILLDYLQASTITTGGVLQKITVPGYDLASNGTWSPDGSAIMVQGVNSTSGAVAMLIVTPSGVIQSTFNRPAGGFWQNPDWR